MTEIVGSIMLAQEAARRTLAACASWQAAVGTDNAETAINRIYHDALPPAASGEEYTREELEGLRPFALVWTDSEGGFTKPAIGAGTGRAFGERGRIVIRIEAGIPEEIAHNPAKIEIRFKNLIGCILDELGDLARRENFLDIESMTLTGPMRSDADAVETQGDFQLADISIDWGAAQ